MTQAERNLSILILRRLSMTVGKMLEILVRISLFVLSFPVSFVIFYLILVSSNELYQGWNPYKIRAQILHKGDDFVEVKILRHSALIDAHVLLWEDWGQVAKSKIIISGSFDEFKVGENVLIFGDTDIAGRIGLENKFGYYKRLFKGQAVSKDRFDPLGADIGTTLLFASVAFPLMLIPVIFPRRKVLNKTL